MMNEDKVTENRVIDKILVVGSILPPELKNRGQRYVVYSSNGVIATLTATDYKWAKFVLVKESYGEV